MENILRNREIIYIAIRKSYQWTSPAYPIGIKQEPGHKYAAHYNILEVRQKQ